MTAATTSSTGYTAAWLLSGDRADGAERLSSILQAHADRGELGNVPAPLLAALRQQLPDVTFGAINIDLGDLLLAAFRLERALTTAAEATRDAPGSTELVELPMLAASVTHQPSVDILVNGTKVASVELELELMVRIDGVLARVAGGRLVELQLRQCTVSGELRYGGQRVAGGAAPLDPGVVVRVSAGALHAAPVPHQR